MQKQLLRVLLPAFALATGLALGGGTALYAADEETTPITTTTVSTTASPTDSGLVIVAVDEQGPAAAAGVARGDVLLTLNGTAVNAIGELEALLAQVAAGTSITLQVQHGDAVRDYTVETGDRNGRAYLGLLPYGAGPVFTTAPIRREHLVDRAGSATLKEARLTQVVVTGVLTDSVAAAAGLQVDDVIVALDGEPLGRPRILRTYLAALEPGDDITLTVLRNAEPLDITLTLAEGKDGRAELGVRLGVTITTTAMNTITSEAMGSMHAVPAQPGFAAPAEFGIERLGDGVQRFFRFFQAAPSMQDFTMPAPGMMVAPEGFMPGHSNSIQVMPAMPVPVPGMMVAPEGFMPGHSTSIQIAPSAELVMPPANFEFKAELSQPVQLEETAIPYY